MVGQEREGGDERVLGYNRSCWGELDARTHCSANRLEMIDGWSLPLLCDLTIFLGLPKGGCTDCSLFLLLLDMLLE